MEAQSNSTVGGDPEPKRGSENRRPINRGKLLRKRACPPLLEREQLLKNGLHSGLANRKLSATMEPDLDGRTVLALQSRCQALSDTYRD